MICEYLTSFTKKKMSLDLKCKNQSGQYLHGWVRVVINGIRADPQPRCGGLFGSVRGVCLFGPAIPWDTTRTLCLHGGVFVMSHIGQGNKFLALYMQVLLTKQTRFKPVRAPLGSKRTISTWIGAGCYMICKTS